MGFVRHAVYRQIVDVFGLKGRQILAQGIGRLADALGKMPPTIHAA